MRIVLYAIIVFAGLGTSSFAAEQSLDLPKVGESSLRILTPQILELILINTKAPDPAAVQSWNFVSANQFQAPSTSEFAVTLDGQAVTVSAVLGFKRRPVYAPVANRDLRIQNGLYLRLSSAVGDGQRVEVKNPSGRLWSGNVQFVARADPLRYSPAIHINQEGYAPAFPKKAMVGYYLGSAGELAVPAAQGFKVIEANSGQEVFAGGLTPRADVGYRYSPTPYQQVYEADFSDFTAPGLYKLVVPQLGTSLPFRIDEGVPMAFTRGYALGLYHQRCGTDNRLPFTRFTHGECHTAAVSVPLPQSSFQFTWNTIASYSADYAETPEHTAPQLKDPASQRYPFVRTGSRDVSGGHHDAGDYSKYTINSAAAIHHLMFAVDAFAGVAALDNLGIPESGDGISDLLQEAKWESDFLSKMQDADGGFYFLVYPREREYEDDVLPDAGDPQVVWPKNTAATAAAVAALAQCASSPLFKSVYPTEAAAYFAQAELGWNFLTNAIARFGKNGAYQKLTHYGHEFIHNDELAWAACEMFLATGEPAYQEKLLSWLPDPNSAAIRRYGWWRLFAAYGCAIRSYAFAARTGRQPTEALDAAYRTKCQNEVLAAADDQMTRAANNAYGTSFPIESKEYRTAGWYFSNERAYDITAAYQLEARAGYMDALLSNLNYEGGCNPVNICYVEGLGWQRQRERVHQYAHNDRRALPPSGFPLGNIQPGFPEFAPYGDELIELCFPRDEAASAPYPFYDRWADTWNVSTEFVVVDVARSLGNLAFLAAQTATAAQSWRSKDAQIAVSPNVRANTPVSMTLTAPGLDLGEARVTWEIENMEPSFNPANFTMLFSAADTYWIEAEASLPDGRRVFAATNITATVDTRTLADALDTTNGVSSVGPPAPWFGQIEQTHDGDDAAQSGDVGRGQRSRMEMTLQGPGTARFWWKASSTDSDDKLRFLVDGSSKKSLAGTKDWQLVSYSLPSGPHTIRWEYARDSSSSSSVSRGWVDQFEFGTLLPPLITSQPASQQVNAGSTVRLTVGVNGSALAYHWHFNGQPMEDGGNVSGTHSSTLTLSGARLDQAGQYLVEVSNAAGWTSSDSATLTVIPVLTLAEALDFNNAWSTSGSPPWFPQRSTTFDNEDAAQSGAIGNGSSTSLQTTVNGPGTVQFWWKVSSEPSNDSLRFYVGSSEKARISGEVNWQFRQFSISSGTQILKWTYKKNSGTVRGQDRAWLDRVEFSTPALAFASPHDPLAARIQFNDRVILSWKANPGRSYQVLYKENLASKEWLLLPGGVSIADGIATITDSISTAPQRFYRIVEE